MSTLVKTKTEDQSGKKFRLVVRSAEEAVRVIRDKLGDKAKVLSVRQVGGEGLKRFISSPKLEVIAQVVEEDDVVEEAIKPEVIKVESEQKSPLTKEDQVPPDPKPKLVEPVVPSLSLIHI